MLTLVIVLGVLNLVVVLYMSTRRGGSGLDGAIRQEFSVMRREIAANNKDLRVEISQGINHNRDSLDKQMEMMRRTVETRLESLQKDNSEKLEKMRATVDEKLQSTLEKRLGESFKQVSDRLEQV